MIQRHEWRRLASLANPAPGFPSHPGEAWEPCVRCGQDWMGAWSDAVVQTAFRLQQDGTHFQTFPADPESRNELYRLALDAMKDAPMCSLVVAWPEGKPV